MILDTNAISDLAENNWTLAGIVDQSGQAALPFVAVAEYQFGLLGSKRPERGIEILSGLMKVLPLLLPDCETIRMYAEIAMEQKTIGHPIPTNDIWIAALARQHAMPILSRDRHFDFIPGIQRIDW